MPLYLADVNSEYAKNKHLKKEEVHELMQWVNQQPHLPEINELQSILFLHATYYNGDKARKCIETCFTVKAANPLVFKDKNPLTSPVKETLNVILFTPLPKKTPEGYTVLFLKLLDSNPSNFNSATVFKIFDMVGMLHIHQDGTSEGYVTVFDMDGAVFGHLFKLSLSLFRRMMHYIQEGLPGRVKRIDFVNTVSFMDMLLAAIKPFMKKELLDIFCLHKTVDDLVKIVPRECLPGDYGGSVESIAVLHEKIKRRLNDNLDFFKWDEQQIADENKRPGKKSS